MDQLGGRCAWHSLGSAWKRPSEEREGLQAAGDTPMLSASRTACQQDPPVKYVTGWEQ